MVIILSLSPFRIFTIYSKQQRLTILNRCTDCLCAQTVRHILTSVGWLVVLGLTAL